MIEEKIIEFAFSQGLWATIAVTLIFYVIRTQEKRDQRQGLREEKYQVILMSLSEQLEIVKDLKNDIINIKNILSSK